VSPSGNTNSLKFQRSSKACFPIDFILEGIKVVPLVPNNNLSVSISITALQFYEVRNLLSGFIVKDTILLVAYNI